MSRLQDLINQYCPNGVEYKKLNDVTKNISTGLNPRKNFKLNTQNATNYYVTVKEITTGKIIFSDKTDKIDNNALEIIQQRSKLEKNDILLSGIGTIGKVALVDIEINNWNCSESIYLLKPIIDIVNPKYLVYTLSSKPVQNFFNSNSRGSTLKGIRQQDLKNLQIPVPPLPVQEEIVRILDVLSELTEQLTTQLNQEIILRKKQYEYYRDNLLDFGKNSGGGGTRIIILFPSYSINTAPTVWNIKN